MQAFQPTQTLALNPRELLEKNSEQQGLFLTSQTILKQNQSLSGTTEYYEAKQKERSGITVTISTVLTSN